MGIAEHRLVAVRREQPERDLVAGRQLLAVQLTFLHAVAQQETDRGIVTQRLLDRHRDEVAVGAQAFVQVGVVRHRPQQVADQVTGGLVAGDEEEHELRARLDVGEVATLDLALEQAGHEVVAGVVAALGDERVDVVGELGVRAGEADAALVAVRRGPGALHDLVGPRRPAVEVLRRRAEQVGDHVVGHRHHVVVDEVERPRTCEQVVEQVVAQLLAERLDVDEPVHRDGGVDDAPHLAVAGLGDLVDELFLVGHHDARLAEAGLEELDVLRRRQHVGVAGEVPGAGGGAHHRAPGAELRQPFRVAGRAQRVERRHARILAPSATLVR